MFTITFVFVTLFFMPVTMFKQKNELIRFYWAGTWIFLAMIAAFSGGSETLRLLKYDAGQMPAAILSGLTVSFVLFVVFGWFRLSFSAIRATVLSQIKKRKKT